MKKILYLMGVDWYWIKQRPQILAEYLARDYDVTVVYLKEVFCRQQLRQDNDELAKSYAVPAIPFRDKNPFIHVVQKTLFHKILKKADEFDIVWIGQPLLYNYIPASYTGKIIYDCMDNHAALCGDLRIRDTIYKTESELVHRAATIFVSSMGLYSKMQSLGGTGKTVLIRNGFVADHIFAPALQKYQVNKTLKIGYFGTIAEWFDFSLLLKSLERFSNLEYDLWGPVSGIAPPEHPRIKLKGVVEHNKLWEKVKDVDVLIMPFKINDIIEDVDPVKLYEYISMGKTIISVYYEEIKRFSRFIQFYKTENDYFKLLEKLIHEDVIATYTEQEQMDFLGKNSWDIRYEELKKYMS